VRCLPHQGLAYLTYASWPYPSMPKHSLGVMVPLPVVGLPQGSSGSSLDPRRMREGTALDFPSWQPNP
jgi:hypothetical protein